MTNAQQNPIGDQERERVKQKVAKLLNMTLDKGASETEALLAAQKAGELMAHYDIAASELQLKSTKSVLGIAPCATYMNRMVGDHFIIRLAEFCDCLIWHEGKASKRTYRFFGMPHDVEIACYLYELISNACLQELEAYQETEDYADQIHKGKSPRITRSDFLRGMEDRLSSRLYQLSKDKKSTIIKATGTALVVVKDAQVKQDFEDLGIRLRSKTRRVKGERNWNARESGQAAGDRVNITSGIGARKQGLLS